MRLEHLEQIIELANTGSFSQAARNLYISQPNLSQSIKQLETELGFALFQRTNDGVIPTRQGRDMIEHIKIIHREYCLLQEYSQNPPQPSRLTLKVATRNINRTNRAFASLVRRHIGSPVSFSFLHYSTIDQVVDLVSGCQADFAMIGSLSPYTKHLKTRLQNSGIEYHKLGTAPISAVVGRRNPLYHTDSPVTLETLHQHTLLTYGNNNEDPSFSLAHAAGLEGRAFGHIQVNSSQLFYHLIQTSSVAGLLLSDEESFSQVDSIENTRVLPISDCEVSGEYGWIKLRRMPLSDIAAELLGYMEEMF